MLSGSLLNIIAAFIVAALITWYSIPKIIKVIQLKKLCDRPDEDRKLHEGNIPTMGGIGIFGGFFIAMLLFVNGYIDHLSVVCASLMIIFFMGQKDDLIDMSPRKRLFIELGAAGLITVAGNIRITTLYGLFGIGELPYWMSIVFTVFIIIFVMNAFNLADGIDGLAASIGIFVSLVYGIWFWIAGDIGYTIIAAAIAGALCAYLPYNFDKGSHKIFMGDTGSLTIGFLLAILSVRFNENATGFSAFRFYSAPAIAISILMLPLFDSVRVTIIRLIQKKNPFRGDKNHLHHRLLRLGLTHGQATLALVAVNSLFVFTAVTLDNLGANVVFLILVLLATALSYLSLRLENKVKLEDTLNEMSGTMKSFFRKSTVVHNDPRGETVEQIKS